LLIKVMPLSPNFTDFETFTTATKLCFFKVTS
jgi:hypothetical protein